MSRLRVGIVSVWCNRGQAVVSRYIRSIFADAGHETFVLARPTNEAGPIKGHVALDDATWNVPNVTVGSSFELKGSEYRDWAKRHRLDVVFCDMNLQFKEIASLREMGVKTIGRFVWERARPDQASAMKNAYDIVYSLTRCERERYASEFEIDSPYVRLGVFPDLIGKAAPKRSDAVYLLFHGGLQGPRKPIRATIEAFSRVKAKNLRLLLKSQAARDDSEPVEVGHDPRITYVCEDMPHEAYHEFFSSCHVCLCPARWEGLGVHLFEALAYEMPVISNDIPPINEVITHGRSGLLVESHATGVRPGGVVTYDPDVADLAACIEEIADPARLAALVAGTRDEARRLDFAHTRADYLALAERALA
jgi:1,2-diacylglycerol 3-alpha-glucosyltransferase